MSSSHNQKLWNTIASRDGKEFGINFDAGFDDNYPAFRKSTSRMATYKNQSYPCVYRDDTSYAGLTIHASDKVKLGLIVNLQYYYVYGFYIGDAVYSYKDEATTALQQFGFSIPEDKVIPYGDSYTAIKSGLSAQEIESILKEEVRLVTIKDAIHTIADTGISWSDKNADLLRVFWSLVEGIRFAAISDTVCQLVAGHSDSKNYGQFYDYAEKWADMCVAAAGDGELNPVIAVYDLHRLGVS